MATPPSAQRARRRTGSPRRGGISIRADGTPRLSLVEPFVLDGDLWLSMMLGSRKAADLVRDPRVLVHSIVTNRDGEEGEVKLRGTARQHLNENVQRRYAVAVSESLPRSPEVGKFHLFRSTSSR